MEQPGTLQQAIDFVRAGDKPHAARILAQYVTQNPNDETGWLWLAASLDQPDKQNYCLQKARTLDPTNPATMEELEFYLGLTGPAYSFESPINLPAPVEAPPEPAPDDTPTSPVSTVKPVSTESEAPPSPPAKKSLSRNQVLILVVLAVLIVIVIVVLAYIVLTGSAGAFSPGIQFLTRIDPTLLFFS